MKGQMKFQIGKNGITSGIIESLNNAFRTHKIIRIGLLKGSGRDKESKKELADELTKKLDGDFKYTIVGFTIVLKKVGRLKNEKKC